MIRRDAVAKESTAVLELLHERGMDNDVDFPREALAAQHDYAIDNHYDSCLDRRPWVLALAPLAFLSNSANTGTEVRSAKSARKRGFAHE